MNYKQDRIRKKEMRYTKFCSSIAFVFVFILLSPTALASSTDSEFPQIIVQKQSEFLTADISANVTNGNHTLKDMESKDLETNVNKVPNKDKVLPVANFASNVSSGYAPRSVLYKDLLQNATLRSWDFSNEETADPSNQRPVYVYTTPGNDIFNLTERNGTGTNSNFLP